MCFNSFTYVGPSSLPVGHNGFQFSFQLPQEIPSSFESEFGNIRYKVLVTVIKQFGPKVELEKSFTVLSPVNLNLLPEAKVQISPLYIMHHNKCSFFNHSGVYCLIDYVLIFRKRLKGKKRNVSVSFVFERCFSGAFVNVLLMVFIKLTAGYPNAATYQVKLCYYQLNFITKATGLRAIKSSLYRYVQDFVNRHSSVVSKMIQNDRGLIVYFSTHLACRLCTPPKTQKVYKDDM